MVGVHYLYKFNDQMKQLYRRIVAMMVDAKSKRSGMDEKSRKKNTHTQRIDGTRMSFWELYYFL
jgi:hypothetical protein